MNKFCMRALLQKAALFISVVGIPISIFCMEAERPQKLFLAFTNNTAYRLQIKGLSGELYLKAPLAQPRIMIESYQDLSYPLTISGYGKWLGGWVPSKTLSLEEINHKIQEMRLDVYTGITLSIAINYVGKELTFSYSILTPQEKKEKLETATSDDPLGEFPELVSYRVTCASKLPLLSCLTAQNILSWPDAKAAKDPVLSEVILTNDKGRFKRRDIYRYILEVGKEFTAADVQRAYENKMLTFLKREFPKASFEWAPTMMWNMINFLRMPQPGTKAKALVFVVTLEDLIVKARNNLMTDLMGNKPHLQILEVLGEAVELSFADKTKMKVSKDAFEEFLRIIDPNLKEEFELRLNKGERVFALPGTFNQRAFVFMINNVKHILHKDDYLLSQFEELFRVNDVKTFMSLIEASLQNKIPLIFEECGAFITANFAKRIYGQRQTNGFFKGILALAKKYKKNSFFDINKQLIISESVGAQSALHRAVIDGDLAAIALLIELGADPALKDWNGHTAFYVAQHSRAQKKIVEILNSYKVVKK